MNKFFKSIINFFTPEKVYPCYLSGPYGSMVFKSSLGGIVHLLTKNEIDSWKINGYYVEILEQNHE